MRSHAKARVKAQATEGSDRFGAENADERFLTTSEVETNNSGNKVVMKSIEGYFKNLTAAVINNKSLIEQLVTNDYKLAATNEDLVAVVKQLSNKIKNPEKETSRFKKTGGSGASQGKRYST